MALPASGQISLNDVNVELGNSGTAQIDMNSAAVRGLFGIASGEIEMADGYGKSFFNGSNWTAFQTTVGANNLHFHSSRASTTDHDEYISISTGSTGYPSYTSTLFGNVSSDGLTWTTDTGYVTTYNASYGLAQVRSYDADNSAAVFHDGTYWWVVAGPGNNKPIQIYRRNSASSWVNVNSGGAGDGYAEIARYETGVGYFAAHVYGDIAFSTNGTSWTHYEPPLSVRYGYSSPKDVFWDSGTSKWVLFYDRGAMYGSHQNSGWAACTTSGGSATNGSGFLFDSGVLDCATDGSGTWVACGLSAGVYDPIIWASTSGYLSWSTALTLNLTNDGYVVGVKYGSDDGKFMAVTSKNKVYTSSNGTSWSHVGTASSEKSFFNYDKRPLSEINGVWLLSGDDGNLQVSTDAGVNWTQVGPTTTSDYKTPCINRSSTGPEIVMTTSGNQLTKTPA